MNDAGTVTIVSLVSPYREDRDIARKRHEDQGLRFMEVFMDVPLDVVQDRDPKGLYKKVGVKSRLWSAKAICRGILICLPPPCVLHYESSRLLPGRSRVSRGLMRPMSLPWSLRLYCPTTR
jgi:hypothetical protein